MNIMDIIADVSNNQKEESLTDEQIVNRLTEHLEHFDVKHTFTRGQVVRSKGGEASSATNKANPRLFIEYLKDPIRVSDYIGDLSDMTSNAVCRTLDCVTAEIHTGTICRFFFDSRELMPHPDFQEENDQ